MFHLEVDPNMMNLVLLSVVFYLTIVIIKSDHNEVGTKR